MRSMNEFYFYTEGLAVGYHGVPLIKNIEIRVRRGEILTLIGPNGAGKTTILRSIIQQLQPLDGKVYLDGGEVSKLTGNQLARRLSVVLTERVRPELMSCEDVVATGRYPYTGKFGILSEDDRRIVKESMELIHISELADRSFTQISDGQKQRVMLARAICQEPEIIVLDEPTSFLDIRYKLEFLSILQSMARKKNLSVIMSLHELDLAERISDQIVCVKGDHVDRFGPPEEIFTPGYIRQLYQMTAGTYEERTGDVELEAVRGEPQVFVIAGNGSGTPVFRRLQREGIPFATGILWENDLDFPAAKALAAELISVEAFRTMGNRETEQAKQVMERCGRVICALPETELEALFGGPGQPLLELYRYAMDRGWIQDTDLKNRDKSESSIHNK